VIQANVTSSAFAVDPMDIVTFMYQANVFL
jgi:hypothetical protein